MSGLSLQFEHIFKFLQYRYIVSSDEKAIQKLFRPGVNLKTTSMAGKFAAFKIVTTTTTIQVLDF